MRTTRKKTRYEDIYDGDIFSLIAASDFTTTHRQILTTRFEILQYFEGELSVVRGAIGKIEPNNTIEKSMLARINAIINQETKP